MENKGEKFNCMEEHNECRLILSCIESVLEGHSGQARSPHPGPINTLFFMKQSDFEKYVSKGLVT